MNKKIAALILVMGILMSMWTFYLPASGLEEGNCEITREVSPSYSAESRQNLLTLENGILPGDMEQVDASSYLEETASDMSFPSVFDPRESNLVTPVTNQVGGTCQIYAAMANLEMFNINRFGDLSDLSEGYFDFLSAYNAFGDDAPNNTYSTGRALHTSASAFQLFQSSALGYGPVLNSQFPVTIVRATHDLLFNTPQHEVIYEYYQLPELKGDYTPEVLQARINELKGLVAQNGSCLFYNRVETPYYNSSKHSLYIPIATGKANDIFANHAVTVVGWDDNYSKNNFTYTPENDGAFIVKNSWGSGWGDGGYFYISYEDYFVCRTGPAGVSDASLNKRYDHHYSHVQYGSYTRIYQSSNPTFWTANIFDIEDEQPQQLESFGIELNYSKTEFEVYLNQNVRTDNGSALLDPQDMVKIYSGYHDKIGYHTIALEKPIALNSANGKFAIVVKYLDDGDGDPGNWRVTGEKQAIGEVSGIAYMPANAGESYYAYDSGTSWTDTSSIHKINYTLNAYTNDMDENSNNPLCIQFSAPGNWGSSASITFYNAGALSGQSVGMDQLASGKFIYRNANLRQATFIIDDGAGHKTNYLYACGSVMVENNTVTYAPAPMQIDFKKPDWNSNIKVYYYSNDTTGTASKPWPGESMIDLGEDWYRYYITDMEDVRVVFNDSSGHQYPTTLKEGIPLKAGQNLIWQDGSYLYDDGTPISIRFYPPESLQGYSSFIFRIDTGTQVFDGTLEDSGNGYCEYKFDTLTCGKLQIFARGGSVIYDKLISGGVTVNDTKLYSKPKEPIEVRFQPPFGWSDNVYIYYYTDDERYVEHSSWPGEAMTKQEGGWYTYAISDMDNTRILFTDGKQQLPALLQEGYPVHSGQELICQDKTCIYDDGETLLDVRFYKPDDWDDNVFITVRDLDSTFSPSSMMYDEGGSVFTKTYNSRTIAEITISDTSGHQTKSFIAAGKVTVSNNRVVQRAKTPIPVTFEKPAGWGKNIYMYVFTNDGSYTSFSNWPGTALTKGADGKYRGEITDTCNARVFFSDGTNQYPLTSSLNGIPVKEGQALYSNGTSHQVSKIS